MHSLRNNILHIIDTLWLGGAQQVLKFLFDNNASNNKLHLLALRHTKEKLSFKHRNVSIVDTNTRWQFKKPLREALRIIDKHNIKTLHCHLPKSQLLGFLIKKYYRPNIKLIYHEQGDIIETVPYNWLTYSLGAKKIELAICCSNYIQQKLTKKTPLPLGKTTVLYNFNGYNSEKSTPAGKIKESRNTYHVGFAGRFIKRKGWRELLKACILLNKEAQGKKITLHIAGTGPKEKLLLKEIHKNKEHIAVEWYGFVENMENFYPRLDIVCVPSHWEPLGKIHLEAMSFGVPVVASDVPGMNELLDDMSNALLFEAGNTLDLKIKIATLLNDAKLYKGLSENGLITAEKYCYKNFEKQLSHIYNTLGV